MSNEDIRIKITADEAGATAAFKRLKKEVSTSDDAIKRLSNQGKMTGQALKDAANVLGPEFQILGDRIDHITGALADVNGASLIAKASLVGLVAVGSYEVGNMLSDLIQQTEAYKKINEEAAAAAGRAYSHEADVRKQQFDEQVEMANLAATEEQKNFELSQMRQRLVNQLFEERLALTQRMQDVEGARSNDMFGYGTEDNANAEEGLRIQQERVKLLEQQFEIVDRMRYGGATEQQEEIERRKQANELAKQQAESAAKQAEEQQRLMQTQTDYLANLDAELVRVRDGEEAYLRLTMARQGLTEETINSALQIRAEINELNERKRLLDEEQRRPKDTTEDRLEDIRVSRPGELQANQQRFITRGVGMRGEEKLLAAAKEQAQRAKEMVAEAKKTNALLAKLPKGVTE